LGNIDQTTRKSQPRIYKLEDTGYDPVVHYDSVEEVNEKLTQALIKANEWDTKIPTGIFYQNELIAPYEQRIADRIPNYLENPPAAQPISTNGKPITDISKILDSLEV